MIYKFILARIIILSQIILSITINMTFILIYAVTNNNRNSTYLTLSLTLCR